MHTQSRHEAGKNPCRGDERQCDSWSICLDLHHWVLRCIHKAVSHEMASFFPSHITQADARVVSNSSLLSTQGFNFGAIPHDALFSLLDVNVNPLLRAGLMDMRGFPLALYCSVQARRCPLTKNKLVSGFVTWGKHQGSR